MPRSSPSVARVLSLAVLLVAAGGCASTSTPLQQDYRLSDTVSLHRLSENVWLHSTTGVVEGQAVQANGLVVVGRSGSLLVDTAWDDEQARLLLRWAAETLRRPVREAVATHFHGDRMGGARAMREAGIPVVAHAASAGPAVAQGRPAPDRLFEEALDLRLPGRRVELFFPGPGHSPDNIVVWLPEERLLYGGCFVKSADATTLGYTGDADVHAWPASVDRVAARYPGAAVVIPGHGDVGDRGLLDHTRALARTGR